MILEVANGAFSAERVRRSVFRVLRESRLCSMATVGPRSRAHINTAYFCCSRDIELYFLSDPAARHCRNLAVNPSMAVTVFESVQEWGGPDRGLQLFGTCRQAKGREAARAARLYGQRFPRYSRWVDRPPGRDRGREYRFYCFRPASLKVLDEAEFGDAVFVIAEVRRRRYSCL